MFLPFEKGQINMKTKLISKKQDKACTYLLYKITTKRSGGYLFELSDKDNASMAMIQTKYLCARRLLHILASTKTPPCQLCDIVEDFRRASAYR